MLQDNDLLPPTEKQLPSLMDALSKPLDPKRAAQVGLSPYLSWARWSMVSPDMQESLTKFYNNRDKFLVKRKGAFYYGSSSVGKSAGVALLAAALTNCGYSCLMISINRLLESFLKRDTMYTESVSLWDRALQVHFLIIDDLGKEADTVAVRATIQRIIEERLLTNGTYASTIITSNLDFPRGDYSMIERRYGENFATKLTRDFVWRELRGDPRSDALQTFKRELE